MKALTVRQPWAWGIAVDLKGVENRTWGTRYRGLLAIHAGKFWSVRGQRSPLIREDLARLVECEPDDSLAEYFAGPMFARGAIVAVAELVDCHVARPVTMWGPAMPTVGQAACCSDRYAEFEVYSDDERDAAREVWHWVLADVRLLDEPVPCCGSLQVWTVPGDVAEVVDAQLAAAA